MTKAQKDGLKIVDRGLILHGKMQNGHAYHPNGRKKLIDRRTLVALDEKGMIEWRHDWGYEDHILQFTQKGRKKLNEITQDDG